MVGKLNPTINPNSLDFNPKLVLNPSQKMFNINNHIIFIAYNKKPCETSKIINYGEKIMRFTG
jgi:hypothetical protein